MTKEAVAAERREEPRAPGIDAGATPSAGRMASLDVFRGITIAGMILVNNPGTWEAIYGPLAHAEWHGWTPTDLVFPFFLFMVGVSIPLALGRRAALGGRQGDLYRKIARRTLVIFGLGLVLSGFPSYELATLRIPGVLQRIAVCYFVASLVFLKTGWRVQAAITVGLLLVYWGLMMLVPVPGYGAGDLSMAGNLAGYVDRMLLAGHTWRPLYDPEGILSTIPAVATTLCGVLTGHLLRSGQAPVEKVASMFVAGVVGIVVGWAWGGWFPINKALWTSSYVLFTAGMALQLLALCYWLVDIKGIRRWATPFLVFGTNALAVYFLAELSARVMPLIEITSAQGTRDLKSFLFERLFASWLAPMDASLAFAVCTVLFWLGVMTVLYRKGIFIKV